VAQGRREDLAQVVLNLLLNAAEACERGGKRAEIGLRVRSSDNRILLEVEDNGPGVPEDTLRLIFRPFYTTKQHGFATGLGLKVCSDVVAAHGGHIEVQNRQSGGAIFRVVLQRLDDESGVHVVARSPADWMPQDQSIRRILIVDDDPVFTRTVQRAVRPHLVRTAATASEAEIALLDTKYAPDLVLCHVLLPGINGNELHRRVCAHRPELRLRFVFCTAGALSAAEADYIKKSGCCTLVKPIDPRRVLNLLEAACYDSLAPNSIRTLRPSEIPEYRSSAPPSK
jgi:CheY-like chemotaxis protein